VLVVEKNRWNIKIVTYLICAVISNKNTITPVVILLPVPTIVHTLVSPMSTCHRAPEEAFPSLEEPRRLEGADPAELGLRRPFGPTFLGIPPALEVERFFLTRPPSLERRSEDEGDAGSLPALAFPKYSLPLADIGVDTTGELGRAGEFDPVP
jgi:hypothetical protein